MVETSQTQPSVSTSVPVHGGGAGPSVAAGHFVRVGGVSSEESELLQDPSGAGAAIGSATLGAHYQAAFSPGALTYTTQAVQVVAPHSYMRFGTAAPYEGWLQRDPTVTVATVAPPDPAPTALPYPDGIAMHTMGTLSVVAPHRVDSHATIKSTFLKRTETTSDSATVVHAGRLVSVNRSWYEDLTGFQAKTSLAVGDNFTTQLGSTIATSVGNTTTFWTGATAATGVGTRLNGNFGLMGNVFTGPVVSVSNGVVEYNGFAGAARFADLNHFAPGGVTLGVAGSASLVARCAQLQTAAKAVGVLAAAVTGALNTALATSTVVGALTNEDIERLTLVQQSLSRGLEGAVAALQIMTCVFAGVVSANAARAKAETSAKISITNGAITLSAGGTTVTIDSSGFRVDAGNPAAYAAMQQVMATVNVQNRVQTAVEQHIYGQILKFGVPGNPVAAAAQYSRLFADDDYTLNYQTGAPPNIQMKATQVKIAAGTLDANAAL